MEPLNVQFVNETDEIVAATNGWEAGRDSADSDDGADAAAAAASTDYCGGAAGLASDQHLRKARPPPGKKTMGRVKIKMEYIKNKVRRYTTFSKRKTGIMKKAYELTVLTGTEVMLLVASETGHVYTFATRKLQPMITSENGKALIQTCLNSPDSPASELDRTASPSSAAAVGAVAGTSTADRSDCSPVKSTAASHTVSNAQSLPLSDRSEKLNVQQVLSSYEDKMNEMHSVDVAQYVAPRNLLPAKSAADSVAATPRQEQRVIVPASTDTHPEQADATYFLKTPAVPVHQASKRPSAQLYQIPGTNQLIPLAVTGAGSKSLPGGTTLFYQTPSGLILASPSTAAASTLPPEAYIVGVPGTPAFALPSKVLLDQSDGLSSQAAGVPNQMLVKLSAAPSETVSPGSI